MNEQEYRDKLMAWVPGAEEFTRDEVALAVGLQCRIKHFPLRDVLLWLGTPDKVSGSAEEGQLVYFHFGVVAVEHDSETAYMFDVVDGCVVDFGTIARYRNNAVKPDGETHFNILDVMEPFDEKTFL